MRFIDRKTDAEEITLKIASLQEAAKREGLSIAFIVANRCDDVSVLDENGAPGPTGLVFLASRGILHQGMLPELAQGIPRSLAVTTEQEFAILTDELAALVAQADLDEAGKARRSYLENLVYPPKDSGVGGLVRFRTSYLLHHVASQSQALSELLDRLQAEGVDPEVLRVITMAPGHFLEGGLDAARAHVEEKVRTFLEEEAEDDARDDFDGGTDIDDDTATENGAGYDSDGDDDEDEGDDEDGGDPDSADAS
jgi:hypothetical protein